MTLGPIKSDLGSAEPVKLPLEKVEGTVEAAPEVALEAARLDKTTYEPEAVVESSGDYKQAEEIIQAFTAVVEAAPTPGEAGILEAAAVVEAPAVTSEEVIPVIKEYSSSFCGSCRSIAFGSRSGTSGATTGGGNANDHDQNSRRHKAPYGGAGGCRDRGCGSRGKRGGIPGRE